MKIDRENDLKLLLNATRESEDGEGLSLNEAVRYGIKQKSNVLTFGHQACYGGIGYKINADSLYIVNGIQYETERYKNLPKAHHKMFLGWLMNESPYKDNFLDKDVDWAIENNVTFHSIDQPGNLVVGCMSAVRAMTENCSCLGYEYFYDLVEAGCTKDMAFIFSYLLQPPYKNGGGVQLPLKTYNSGHTAIGEGTLSVAYVQNFIGHRLVKAQPNSIKNSKNYNGVQSLFGEPDNKNSFVKLILGTETAPPVKTVNEWGEVVTSVHALELPRDKMIKRLVKFNDMFYKEYVK